MISYVTYDLPLGAGNLGTVDRISRTVQPVADALLRATKSVRSSLATLLRDLNLCLAVDVPAEVGRTESQATDQRDRTNDLEHTFSFVVIPSAFLRWAWDHS